MKRRIHIVVAALSLVWLFHTATDAVLGGDSPAPNAAGGPVVLTQDDWSFTLANGLVTARIEKRSGNLVSLTYEGLELLAQGERFQVMRFTCQLRLPPQPHRCNHKRPE